MTEVSELSIAELQDIAAKYFAIREYQTRFYKNNKEYCGVKAREFYNEKQCSTLPGSTRCYARYTVEEIDYIRDNLDALSIEQIALNLNRTYAGICGAIERYTDGKKTRYNPYGQRHHAD